ncbi:DNA/RNA non-specific endonuclease [Sergentomyia squamirostris]
MILKVTVVILALVHLAWSQCSVNIRNDIPVRDPVYLNQQGQLWSPNGAALTWSSGQPSFISCTGSGNTLTFNGQRTSTKTCVSGTTFNIGGSTTTSSQLACTNTITGDTTNTGSNCANDGTILNIGFNTYDTPGFVTYIQSCYSFSTGSTRYTRHILPGRAINSAVIESSRPSFKTAGSAPQVSPATSYTQVSQMSRLTFLLGSQAQAERFLTSSSFMSRGHLAPDGDGIYRSWQFATYFYTNVAPQWQQTNGGNWLRVEDKTRTKAHNIQQDLLIFTGTFDILTLPHVNGQQIPLTLEAGGIEVPKWYWKIVKSTTNNAAIALITLNNPFATSISANELLCPDICSSSGWGDSNFSNFARGYTYCCNVQNLMSRITWIPSEASANNVLNW